MTFSQNIIALIVLIGLFILAYSVLTKKTLTDIWREFVAIIKGE